MNWKVEKGTMADARTIVEFQIDMALESEGTVLNRETILNGVIEGLSDPAKGTYYLIRTENGQTACKKQVFDQQFSEKLVSADFGKQLLHILIDKAVMRQRAAASLLGA